MNFYTLKIGDLCPKFPVIQGGMGIGVSLHQLASSVARCGGIGVISGAQIGFREPDFLKNPHIANLRAIESEIKLCREKAPEGIIGINLMVAMKNYAEYVKKAVECKIDLIISGAGLPLDLPSYTKGSTTKIAPIVSSAKAALLICRMWDKKNQCAPDAIIVEGPLAGGHLGFHNDEVKDPKPVLDIVNEVKSVIHEFADKYKKNIPVIAAGGIYTGDDIVNALNNGADGVQMGTRFVTTHECDAASTFKQTYIDATEDMIGVIKSPVGMPGRAILNPYILNSPGNKKCYYKCLHKCGITDIPYCISDALINAANGDVDNALLFCGSNAYLASKIEYVSDIFEEFATAFSKIN
ncbi:MAG: NAD(P)H-dependent flavin oxidoreductase [Cellulosilyticaceae bacterium]